MQTIRPIQLHLLRAMYLLIFVGLSLSIWPGFFSPANPAADSHSVISSILVAFSLMSLLGLRYPLKMVPLLIFELLWKSLWTFNFALRMWLGEGLDEYASETLGACLVGIVLTPIAIPWNYVFKTYFKESADPWFPKKVSRRS